jgi:hypothetical protein
MPGRKHGLPHGFVSKAQWRLFAVRPDLRAKYFKKEAHKVIRERGKITGYRSLPSHVRSGRPVGGRRRRAPGRRRRG